MQGSILVVERDQVTRRLVAGNFRNAGYRVSSTGDYAEADALVQEMRPDLAVLDWAQDAPGLTFARQLRRDQRTAEVSIIMLSSATTACDPVAALECGADDFVAKPFSMRELLARAKAVLRRRAPQLADVVVEAGGLSLDPASQRVTSEGRDIELRNTEYNLLHYFMTHPQRIHSRRKLLDEIWGDDVYVEERTVDVHVRRLRRALAPSYDNLVETVRGVGYRFRSIPSQSVASHASTVTELAAVRASRSAHGAPRAHVA